MKLTFYGVRGSYPISRPNNVRYGGNSTCLHFRLTSGAEFIFDGGSGIVKLGREMMDREFSQGNGKATVLVGHTHWDHILGYPFFLPFYVPGNDFRFISAGQTGVSIHEILSGQHHDLHFPVPFKDLAANIEYDEFSIGDSLAVDGMKLTTFQLNHPGLTVAYRLEGDSTSVVVITDTARIHAVRLGDNMGGLEPDSAFSRRYTDQLTALCANADVLVHDAHFFDHEIQDKEHWGHATGEDALILARNAGVKHLVLFHHAPEHNDTEVDQILQATRDLGRRDSLKITAATEGVTIDLGEAGP